MILLLFHLSFQIDRLAWLPIAGIGPQALEIAKSRQEFSFWIECGHELLVGVADPGAVDAKLPLQWLPADLSLDHLFLARDPHAEWLDGSILARFGRFTLLSSQSAGVAPKLAAHEQLPGCHHESTLLPLAAFRNQTLVAEGVNHYPASYRWACCSVQDMVDLVDGPRWHADVATLAQWNRHTLQPGNLLARDWLVAQFQALTGLAVSTPAFTYSSHTSYNVVAVLNGTVRPNDWYIVGGHFDSTSQAPSTAAPGAEDNASGAAAVLEMARIFSENRPEATIIFVCYSGEEQGLYGSAAHAAQIAADGHQSKVKGVMIMDMIGFTADSDLDCLLETHSNFQNLLSEFSQAAQTYTTLRIETSLNPFGSDHMPFINRGMPALLTIENDWNIYPHYHKTTDTISQVNLDMGREVIKMNVAVLASWAGLPEVQLQALLPYWSQQTGGQTPPDTNGNGVVDLLDILQFSCAP